ncbi:MAG: PQQ-binding-like beta-propeller repeat protein [Candidatus Aminicenantales bacterium]
MRAPSILFRRLAAWSFLPAAALGVLAAQAPSPPAWSLTETARLRYEGEINQRMVADGARFYFTTRRGWVYAVDAERRTVAWRFGAEAPIHRPPAVSSSLIAAADEDRTVYCLNADGLLIWAYRGDGPPAADPLWLGQRLIVALRSGPLIALNAQHPEEIWRAAFEKDLICATAAWRGCILCACRDGLIRVLDADGRPAGTIAAGGPLAGSLTVEEDRIYAGREDGVLCALDAGRRSVVWRMRIGGEAAARPVIDGRRMFLTASNGALFAVNKNNGGIYWWRPLPSRVVFGPALWRGRVVAASASPVLFSFKPRTGEPAGDYRGVADWKADPQVRGGLLLLHTYDPDALEGTLWFLGPPSPPLARTDTTIKGEKSP